MVADGALGEVVEDDRLAGEGEVLARRARVDQVPVPDENVPLLRQEDGLGQAVLCDRALDRGLVLAALGVDGPMIKLRTSYKNIIIQASAARQTQAKALVN